MSKDRDNSMTARIGRYGKVSTTVAGLGLRVAGEKFLGLKIERGSHAQDLLAALGNLKGPIMKVGQILATIPEALPPEYANALRELQSNAPPMGPAFVRRRMKSELGPEWESRFQSFDLEAAAAASLGQVHKAITKKGELVACKLQYPDMGSAVEADLNQLKFIFGLYEKTDSAFSTKQVHAELADRLREELDYTLEAKHERLYGEMLKEQKDVHVPKVIDDLSTARLLTTTWMDGKPILSFVGAPMEQRKNIALSLFHAWYVPLYYYGVIHGDPHLGNYSVRDDDSINLLDFGCVRIFRPAFVGAVIDLYHALMQNDQARAVHAYEVWGFKNLSKDLIETLNMWAGFLYGPLMDDKSRTIGKAEGGIYGRETASQVHQRLRQFGGIDIPREFVFMDRAALGLGSVFIHLQAEVNWYRVFNDMIAGFDAQKMAAQQAEILPRYGLNLPQAPENAYAKSNKKKAGKNG